MLFRSKKVNYRSGNDLVPAEKQMEYYETGQKAVARGNAVAFHDGKRLHAEVLESYFRKTADNKSEVYEIRAFENVMIVTEQDVVRADRAIYNVKSELATLTGNVRINRGESVLEGDSAEINMKTGVSRLLGNNSRPRGLIVPQKREPANKGSNKSNNKGVTPK